MERVKECSAVAGIHSCTVRDPQKRRMACQTNVTGRAISLDRASEKVSCQFGNYSRLLDWNAGDV